MSKSRGLSRYSREGARAVPPSEGGLDAEVSVGGQLRRWCRGHPDGSMDAGRGDLTTKAAQLNQRIINCRDL
jgi:hypothetical protein